MNLTWIYSWPEKVGVAKKYGTRPQRADRCHSLALVLRCRGLAETLCVVKVQVDVEGATGGRATVVSPGVGRNDRGTEGLHQNSSETRKQLRSKLKELTEVFRLSIVLFSFLTKHW